MSTVYMKPYGIDFAAAALQTTLAASAVPTGSRNLFHVLAPLAPAALGTIREAVLPGKMEKDNWLNSIAPIAAGVLGAGILAFMHLGTRRK